MRGRRGAPPDLVLANECRQISSDRSTILTAADVLRTLPTVASMWSDGLLSRGQVRNICRKASRLRVDDRELLDRRIAATAEDADAYGPDGLLDAVDRAVWDLQDAAKAGKTSKPLIDVLVDLSQVTSNAAGTVDLHVDGPLATLTARTVEALTEDADLRVTLMDGARPLATSRKRHAPAVPSSVRRAVALRDRGDRMPGSRGDPPTGLSGDPLPF